MNLTRLNWGWRIAIVYTTFALATLGFVAFALTQEVDLVRGDYYEYSLKHDERMTSRQHADALGQAMTVGIADAAIRIQIPPEQASSAKGTVVMYRASSTHLDKTMPLSVDTSGVMVIPTAGMERGKWTVTVTWTAGPTTFEKNVVVELP